MANRDCNGDFFTAEGVCYYRCLWDSAVMLAPAQGDKCPNCDRVIDGTEAGEWEVRITMLAIAKSGTEVRLPGLISANEALYLEKQRLEEMLLWAYSKLRRITFCDSHDAMMADRIKLWNEHGVTD